MGEKAVFIDRDGTINEEVSYLNDPDRFAFISGALEGLRLLQEARYRIIIVTNQSGIARGKISPEQLDRIHIRMRKGLVKNGIAIGDEEIYFCPHMTDERCECRKPNVRSFKDAETKFKLDADKCYVVGDKTSDIEAGKRGGYKTILLETGYAGRDGMYKAEPDFRVKNLLEAAKLIISKEGG